MKLIKYIIIILTTLTFGVYIAFNCYVAQVSSRSSKELPVLQEDRKKSATLTSIGIILVGVSGYIFVDSFDGKE